MIYLDNAATSFPKPKSVITAVEKCIKTYCGNPGRGSHRLSLKASEEIYTARENLAKILSIDSPEKIIFTTNATYALNIAIKTTITDKCHVITSSLEHNSIIRPLTRLSNISGLEYSVFSPYGNLKENIIKCIRPDTKAIICTLMSNVTGFEIPLKELSEIKKEYNLILIVDASQMLGHKKIDLTETPCDVLCGPAHKALFGIQGCGFCVFCDNKKRDSFIEGGSGTNSKSPFMPEYLPERFEAGTLPTPSIVALNAGINYIRKFGFEYIEDKISKLTDCFYERILCCGTEIMVGKNGIISFSLNDIPSSIIASELDRAKICVRSGFHCAPWVHRELGSEKFGLTRVSLSLFNSVKEADKLYLALKEIKNKY